MRNSIQAMKEDDVDEVSDCFGLDFDVLFYQSDLNRLCWRPSMTILQRCLCTNLSDSSGKNDFIDFI